MKKMLCRFLFVFLIFFLPEFTLRVPHSILAAECITSFQSDIAIATDGLMTITETISVISEGEKIKR